MVMGKKSQPIVAADSGCAPICFFSAVDPERLHSSLSPMYAKVPGHLKEPLLRELRHLRLRSALKHYPVLVLIFSSVAALALFLKEHAIVRLIRDIVPSVVSD